MRVTDFGPLKGVRAWIRRRRQTSERAIEKIIPEISADEAALLRRYAPFTMTSIERQWALIKAVDYLNANRIGGDFVECGVWRGGNLMIAKELCRKSAVERKFYLFDTFAGMSSPTAADVTYAGADAGDTYRERVREGHVDWVYASLDDVRDNFRRANLLDDRVIFVKGKVEDTLAEKKNLPDRIALLRLDTDFYESTRTELEILYPRLASGGVLIVDDYGHWRGARRAVDEYFRNTALLWSRIDYTARMTLKP
ncbi:MAG TPA: TylF/MycF/NovP-related O-methyltransferase [Xanthobacteraceae bacterium]|nr:TylF/MycF/NovP-related O-methyltransferase [Xanthobacteraceae bacterium]